MSTIEPNRFISGRGSVKAFENSVTAIEARNISG